MHTERHKTVTLNVKHIKFRKIYMHIVWLLKKITILDVIVCDFVSGKLLKTNYQTNYPNADVVHP